MCCCHATVLLQPKHALQLSTKLHEGICQDALNLTSEVGSSTSCYYIGDQPRAVAVTAELIPKRPDKHCQHNSGLHSCCVRLDPELSQDAAFCC